MSTYPDVTDQTIHIGVAQKIYKYQIIKPNLQKLDDLLASTFTAEVGWSYGKHKTFNKEQYLEQIVNCMWKNKKCHLLSAQTTIINVNMIYNIVTSQQWANNGDMYTVIDSQKVSFIMEGGKYRIANIIHSINVSPNPYK